MAHIQTPYGGLWKPQDLSVDKISAQKMFIDNINAIDDFIMLMSTIAGLPVADIIALRAVDTSDEIIFSNGKMILVTSTNSIYSFNRLSEVADDGINCIAPTLGGGRWILTASNTLIPKVQSLSNYEKAGGTATAITLNNVDLTDGAAKTFIVSSNNSGAVTTINGKNLYKPGTTTSPKLIAGKAVTIWYDTTGGCFFIKASAEGNAVASNVLAGKTFSNDDDTGLTGTIPVVSTNGTAPVSVVGYNGYVDAKPQEGYWDGVKYLSIADPDFIASNFRADKNIFGMQGAIPIKNPDYSDQIPALGTSLGAYTGDAKNYAYMQIPNGYYLNNVNYVRSEQPDLLAQNILSGKSIFGIAGSLIAGKPHFVGLVNIDKSSQIYTYYRSGGSPSNAYRYTVSGLSFTPKFILAVPYYEYTGFATGPMMIYAHSTTYNNGITMYDTYWAVQGSSQMNYLLTNNAGWYYMNSSGFCLPTSASQETHMYVLCLG